jgi:hypothetical protein
VLSSSCEDEDIKESHEGTDVRELDDCYNGGFGKNDRRETACWPWCLGVMSLADCQYRVNGVERGRRLPFRDHTGSR